MSQVPQQVAGFDLNSVLYELQRLKFPAHKWRLLANSLRVASVADDIDANHRDVAGKLQAVVRHWMDNATQHNQWITLVEAVIMCDECGVAEQLATAVGVEYTPSGRKRLSGNPCTISGKRPALQNEGDQDPPTITQDPKETKVRSGSEASFTCVASSDLPMEFSWQKDGSGIIFSSSITVNTSRNMSTLMLKPVSSTDAGSYTCTASNDAGSVTSNAATLQVTDPPTIIQDLKKAKVRSGSEASFTCVASSDLPMKFSLQKDCSGIIFSPSITVNTSGNMSTLILKNVSTTDAGSYTCTASNDAGSMTSNAATLQVTDTPTITQDPKETTVRSGSEASFTCVASSDLPMKFSWQKDGSSIIFSPSITVNTSGNMSTLILKPVSTTDAGSYTCTVSNDAGSMTSNAATLQVTGFDLDSVLYELQRLKFPASKWRLLANGLRVASVVDNIGADHRDVAGKLQAVISHWVKSTTQHNQWITLVEAIDMCSEHGVAERLATAVGVEYTPLPPPPPPTPPTPPISSGRKRLSENTCGDSISKRPAVHTEGDQATGPLSVYVGRLKQIYQAPPPTLDPLPQCGHIKLAMIRGKGKRRGRADETMVRHQVKGEVEAIVASSVPIEVDRIFDSGLFDEERQVILVEGPPGGGKTSLTYHYGQEWAAGNLSMFDVVAVVHLRTLVATQVNTLPDLLLLACASRNDEEITRDMIRRYVMKCPRLLLVLDGWDETPNELRKLPFITEICRSMLPQSKILITSRPETSVDLHGLANRVEIVGFSQENIHKYFQSALSTELDHDKVEDGCRKLREHFRNHPVIQSCCSIPLNAAILAHLFLTDQSLPSTRHELFLMLVLSCVNRELKERHSHGDVTVLSLDELPRKYKIVLNHICVLAFEGVQQNKVVFPQEELVRLKLPLDLPALGLLQIVKSFDRIGQTSYRNFINLSIQELLAAYHISQLREGEQVKVFEDLLDKPRFSAVLQFYAAFTRFTNQGVRDIVTGIDLANKQHILLTIMRCCFEANSQDQLLFQEIVERLDCRLWIANDVLTPFDCMSVGYFLAFALRASQLCVTLDSCSIDDHSLGLLLGELSRHNEACPAGVLQGVAILYISLNNIGDDGITRLANALQGNTTMKILDISSNYGIAVNGAKSLGRALSFNSSLEELYISNTSIGDKGIDHIANALQTNTSTTMKVLDVSNCDISDKGAGSLARVLAASSSLESLYISSNSIGDDGIAHIATAVHTLKSLTLYVDGICHYRTATDKAALSLAAALTTNTSMEVMMLSWTSTHPDTTLKKMAGCVKKSTLRGLTLDIGIPHLLCKPRVISEEVREWYWHVEVGGKEFILSLEDSHLKSFSLSHQNFESSVQDLKSQICTSLEGAASSVNSTRKMNNLPEIKFEIHIMNLS